MNYYIRLWSPLNLQRWIQIFLVTAQLTFNIQIDTPTSKFCKNTIVEYILELNSLALIQLFYLFIFTTDRFWLMSSSKVNALPI